MAPGMASEPLGRTDREVTADGSAQAQQTGERPREVLDRQAGDLEIVLHNCRSTPLPRSRPSWSAA